MIKDFFTLVDRRFLYLFLECFNLFILLFGSLPNILLQLFGFCAQRIVAQLLYLGIHFFHLFYEGLYQFHVACGLISKKRLKNFIEIHFILCCYFLLNSGAKVTLLIETFMQFD